MAYQPDQDGIDHINVYSKGNTQLGIFLSNFTPGNITTEDGVFYSVEGYWYWLLCPPESSRDQLRGMYGFLAKKRGRILVTQDYPAEDDLVFQRKITGAIRNKIVNSKYLELFKSSTLPFAHYYIYNNSINEPQNGKWILKFLEELRVELRT